jgi:hypothetical protein
VTETIEIPSRFRGPPASANGGYACGVVARYVDGPAEVTLRSPPPLERPLQVRQGEEGPLLLDGEQVVATARRAGLDIDVPATVSVAEAERAAAECELLDDHPFPGCFVCGPGREDGDGLKIFPGPVEGREIVAAAWTPDRTVAATSGEVRSEIVWAALDCPTSFGVALLGSYSTAVLGRLTGKVLGTVEVERPHVVIAWPIGRDGRKLEGGCALFTDEGELKAFSRGLWIELKK